MVDACDQHRSHKPTPPPPIALHPTAPPPPRGRPTAVSARAGPEHDTSSRRRDRRLAEPTEAAPRRISRVNTRALLALHGGGFRPRRRGAAIAVSGTGASCGAPCAAALAQSVRIAISDPLSERARARRRGSGPAQARPLTVTVWQMNTITLGPRESVT